MPERLSEGRERVNRWLYKNRHELIAEVMRAHRELDAERVTHAETRKALRDAHQGMIEMRPYVSDYFAEKWDHDGYIRRAKAALEADDART